MTQFKSKRNQINLAVVSLSRFYFTKIVYSIINALPTLGTVHTSANL